MHSIPSFLGAARPAHDRARLGRRPLQVGALALAVALATPAFGQSITGGLHGSAPAGADTVIVVSNPATGFSKRIHADANGRYRLELLAAGSYRVTLRKDGQVVDQYTVHVSPNVSSPVPPFVTAAPGAATKLAGVEVSSHALRSVINPIDVSTPELSTVWDAQLTRQLPIPQGDIYAIPMLNSGVGAAGIQGINLPQVAGAGPTENRYYFNEFDTTYDVTGVGAVTFPQEAVRSTQFIAGNAGLSWTSTTGGVTAATLKQGSNRFHAGYSAYYTLPTSRVLNPRGKDTWYSVNGSRNRNRYLYQSDNHAGGSLQQYVWGSGALVQDKLFFFALLGQQPASRSTTYSASQQAITSPRGKSALINLTWNLSNNQSLDVAGYETWNSTSTNTRALAITYDPSSVTGAAKWSGVERKQKLLIGNYHWYINQDMSLRLMAGYMRYNNVGSDSYSKEGWASIYHGASGISQQLAGGGSQYMPARYYYAKRGFKGDFSWQLGAHKLTVGGEKYTVIYHYEPRTNPNFVWQYYDYAGMGYAGSALGNGGFIPASGQYAYTFLYTSGGTFLAHNNGYYLFDEWQALPDLVLSGGVRLDQMQNLAANHVTYMDMTILSPHLGLAWDVHGDSTLKIGANAGKYTLPMPSSLSYLSASAQTYKLWYYAYDGINPDGTPINPQQLGNPIVYSDGQVPQLSAVASQGLKNTYQYEFQIYAQQQLGASWSALASLNAHVLKNLVDQTCDQTGALGDYVRTHGHPGYAGLAGNCIEFNPGRDIVLRDDLDGTGQLADITIPAGYLGMPKAKRTYYGLNLRLTHAASSSEPYFLTVGYTWGHLYGNSDGYANLSKGTNPTPGYSGNYQFAQFTAGNYGNLAGDIRHQLIASGVYYFGHGFRIGGLFKAHTGAPSSCLGTWPDGNDATLNSQGAVTHYCQGQLSAEGSTWRAPTYWQLDVDLGYDVELGAAGKLSIDLRISNLTNRAGVISRDMVSDSGLFEADGSLTPAPTYLSINGLQAPRATFLYLRYTY